MMSTGPQMPAGQAFDPQSLISPTEHGVASRILAKTPGGNLTLFAFDAGQRLTEHTSPFGALVIVLEGVLTLTLAGAPVRARPQAPSCACLRTSTASMRLRPRECC